jgi:MFS family permease
MAEAPRSAEPDGGPPSMWRALAHRNYRLFFGGQGISMIGTWMTRVASGWLVYSVAGDHAELLLGVVGFAGQAPTFFLAPFAGVVVDRVNRHRLLVATQVMSLIQSALLAVVAFRGEPGAATVWQIIILAFFQGIINAFDMPTRQAFLVEMVGRKEDLPNAIALNSSLVNGARLIGPAIAGVLIFLTNPGWCFTIDAISYVAVIAALLAMTVPARARRPHHEPVWHGLREGFTYAFGFAPIRALLLLLALVSFMGMPYTVLMPVFAVDLVGPDDAPKALGYLMAASGVGALTGALYLAARRTVVGLGRTIILATSLLGLGLIGFAFSEWLLISLLLMLVTGFGLMVQLAASNTILQTIVDEDKRGRVMSFYSMAFMGMAPFGSLFAGALAARYGAATTVLLGGLACLAGAGTFALKLPQLRTLVRPLYVRLGILPEVAAGLQTAAELTRPPED